MEGQLSIDNAKQYLDLYKTVNIKEEARYPIIAVAISIIFSLTLTAICVWAAKNVRALINSKFDQKKIGAQAKKSLQKGSFGIVPAGNSPEFSTRYSLYKDRLVQLCDQAWQHESMGKILVCAGAMTSLFAAYIAVSRYGWMPAVFSNSSADLPLQNLSVPEPLPKVNKTITLSPVEPNQCPLNSTEAFSNITVKDFSPVDSENIPMVVKSLKEILTDSARSALTDTIFDLFLTYQFPSLPKFDVAEYSAGDSFGRLTNWTQKQISSFFKLDT